MGDLLKLLHLSDIHLGSGFSHGHIDPETLQNTRLGDFERALSFAIDRAIAEPVDLVLFGGDAFPNATPPPFVQETFARQFRRLAAAGIPTVLVAGNHDQHAQGNGGVSLSIYRTLGVPGFVVGDSLKTHRLTTAKGDLQVVTLPWINRSSYLTRKETAGLSLEEIQKSLTEKLTIALEGEIRQLDPHLPTVLLAHLMAERSTLGAERLLAVGLGSTVPLDLLTRPVWDYVALGHVHRHQNLNPTNSPPVIYPGSIERVDFSEEKEAKGFVLVTLAKGQAIWEFCPVPARPFVTVEVDVSGATDPETAVLGAIARHPIADAVVRVIYRIRPDQLEQIHHHRFHQALTEAHHYSLKAEVISQLTRVRLPELGMGDGLDPLTALQTYVDNREDLQEIAGELLDAARDLLVEEDLAVGGAF